jgi:hypothetical protein
MYWKNLLQKYRPLQTGSENVKRSAAADETEDWEAGYWW